MHLGLYPKYSLSIITIIKVTNGLDGAGLATEAKVDIKINSSIVTGTDDDPNSAGISTIGKTIYIDTNATIGNPKVWVNAGGTWLLIANAI